MSGVEKWMVNTDIYPLNTALCGSLRGGFIPGTVTTICGAPASGKTLIAQYGFARSLTAKGMPVLWIDTEKVTPMDEFEGNGVDISHLAVQSAPDVDSVQSILAEARRSKERIGIVIDSLNGLNVGGDPALAIRELYKTISGIAKDKKWAVLVLNKRVHGDLIYGGEGAGLGSDIILDIQKTEVMNADSTRINGNAFTLSVEKSPFVKTGEVFQFYVSYARGMNAWHGVSQLAKRAGFAVQWSEDVAHELRVAEVPSNERRHWILKDPKLPPSEWSVVDDRTLATKECVGAVLTELDAWARKNVTCPRQKKYACAGAAITKEALAEYSEWVDSMFVSGSGSGVLGFMDNRSKYYGAETHSCIGELADAERAILSGIESKEAEARMQMDKILRKSGYVDKYGLQPKEIKACVDGSPQVNAFIKARMDEKAYISRLTADLDRLRFYRGASETLLDVAARHREGI